MRVLAVEEDGDMGGSRSDNVNNTHENNPAPDMFFQTMVKLTGLGDLLVRTHTLPPEPKRVEDICARSEVSQGRATVETNAVCGPLLQYYLA